MSAQQMINRMIDDATLAASALDLAATAHESVAFAADDLNQREDTADFVLIDHTLDKLRIAMDMAEEAYDKSRLANRNIRNRDVPLFVRGMRDNACKTSRQAHTCAVTMEDTVFAELAMASMTAAGCCRRAASTYRRAANSLSTSKEV